MQPPQGVISRTLGMADFSDAVDQAPEGIGILLYQHSFIRAHAKNDLRRAAQRTRLVRQTCLGEFQSMAAEGDLGWRDHRHFGFGHQLPDPVDGLRKALPGLGLVGPMHQPGPDVAAVRDLDFLEMVVAVFQFV